MNSKTSFFNKSLFKSDIKRFWWVGILETLMIFAVGVLPFYSMCLHSVQDEAASITPDLNAGIAMILPIFAVGIAVLLFSYMHFGASVSTLHSIPLKRSTLFSTKLISGAVLTILPILINAVILIIMLVKPEFSRLFSMNDIGKWIFTGIIYTVVVFSLAVLTNMMTGNPVGTLVFTAGFIGLPLVILGFFESFFNSVIHGCAINITDTLLTHIYISPSDITQFSYYIIYVIGTVVFLTAAYLLYRARKLESYGEVITFSWLKPVFITIVSVLSSILSYEYFVDIMNKNSILCLLPFGFIGTIIAWMIARKSLKLKGILKPIVIYFVVSIIFIAVIHFDVIGFEKKIPSLSDIESVSVTTEYDNYNRWTNDTISAQYHYTDVHDASIKDGEDIKKVIALHKELINTKTQSGEMLPIVYKLKNGKTIKRVYTIDTEDLASVLEPVYNCKPVKAERFPIIDGTKKTYTSISIGDRRFGDNTFKTLYPDNEQMMRLLDALQKDVESRTYSELISQSGAASISLDVSYTKDIEFDTPNVNISESKKNNISAISDTYKISVGYKNTLEALREIGFYDELPKVEDISNVKIYAWKDNNDPDVEADYVVYDNDGKSVGNNSSSFAEEINDPKIISELYSQYDNMIELKKFTNYENLYNIRIKYSLKNGKSFDVSCSYNSDTLPQQFSKYFE